MNHLNPRRLREHRVSIIFCPFLLHERTTLAVSILLKLQGIVGGDWLYSRFQTCNLASQAEKDVSQESTNSGTIPVVLRSLASLRWTWRFYGGILGIIKNARTSYNFLRDSSNRTGSSCASILRNHRSSRIIRGIR